MRPTHDDQRRAASAVTAARAAERAGDYQGAARHYTLAGSLVEGEARAWAYHEASVAYRRCGDLHAALKAVRVADRAVDGTEQSYLAGLINLTAGNIHADMGNWGEAAACAVRGGQIFRAIDARIEFLYTRLVEARCFAAAHNRSAALDIYQSLINSSYPFEIRTQALNNLALLRMEMGDSQMAIRLMLDDAHLCKQVGDRYGEFVAHVNLARCFARIGDEKRSARYSRRALELGAIYKQTPAFQTVKTLIEEQAGKREAGPR